MSTHQTFTLMLLIFFSSLASSAHVSAQDEDGPTEEADDPVLIEPGEGIEPSWDVPVADGQPVPESESTIHPAPAAGVPPAPSANVPPAPVAPVPVAPGGQPTAVQAWAQPAPVASAPSYDAERGEEDGESSSREHSFSLTISPIHLIFPVVELMAEVALADNIGVALIAGGGSITIESLFGDASETFGVFEIGSQFLFYPFGDFDHGMQLGVEALFVLVSGQIESEGLTGTGSGLSVGPLAGYKYTASFGITFNAQFGVALMGIAASASDGTTTETSGGTEVGPLINLNAGWSF